MSMVFATTARSATRDSVSGLASVRPSPVRFDAPQDECPFQPYAKLVRNVQVLRPESIEPMAAWWATIGRDLPNPNAAFAESMRQHPAWFDQFTLLFAHDQSLMLPGHQNLVMHMVDDPTQIPDSPPKSVMERLLLAERLYPQAKIFYVEPVFGVSNDSSGLPVPMTEEAFLLECGKRLLSAQAISKSWAWFYRGQDLLNKLVMHIEARAKAKAMAKHQKRVQELEEIARQAEEESARIGRTVRPRIPLREAEELIRFEKRYAAFARLHPEVETMTHRAVVTHVEVILRRFDPLLLLELPNEPGKLRLIGHWFWQQTRDGKRRLHLHLED